MIARVFASLVTTLVRSLRIKWHGGRLPDRAVIAFWHSKMLAGWWISREHSVALVSKSKDGDYLSSILSAWDYQVIRGSAGKNGMEALREAIVLVDESRADRLVLTPDGPRGPAEVFKRGAFIAAKELNLPLIFLDIRYHGRIVLDSSWDRFEIPYPFSRVDITPCVIDTRMFPDERAAQDAYLAMRSRSYQTDPATEHLEPAFGG